MPDDSPEQVQEEVEKAVKELCLAYLPRLDMNPHRMSHLIWTIIDFVYTRSQIYPAKVSLSQREIASREELIVALTKVYNASNVQLSEKRRIMHNACKPAIRVFEHALAEAMGKG